MEFVLTEEIKTYGLFLDENRLWAAQALIGNT
jgi:hypothetical protein